MHCYCPRSEVSGPCRGGLHPGVICRNKPASLRGEISGSYEGRMARRLRYLDWFWDLGDTLHRDARVYARNPERL